MQVISYSRFSSPKQSRGDSMRRQMALAEQWCKRHGHQLDTSLRLSDEGISGWSGANMRTGALSVLLRMLDDKQVEPGSILLIEALDRLTRTDLTVAVPLLLQLLNAGLTIVTLQDDKVWSKSGMADMTDFVMSVMLLARGYEESQRKSKLVGAAFEAHRQRASNQIFGSAPGWLRRKDKTSRWVVDKSKAASVKNVFELSAKGYGSVQIAKIANEKKWIVPTRLATKDTQWHVRLPGYLMRNRAVLGEHEFRLRGHAQHEKHWKGESTGIVIHNFYPQIISEELWHQVQSAISARGNVKRRDEHYYNIWSGLLYCGHCGAPMHRKVEYRGVGHGQIKCSAAHAGQTDCPSASLKLTDGPLLMGIIALAAPLMGINRKDDFSTALQIAESRLAEVDEGINRIVEVITDTKQELPALKAKLGELGKQRELIKSEIKKLEQRISTVELDWMDSTYAENVLAVLYTPTEVSKELRADCNIRLRRAIKTIWIWPYNVAMVAHQSANPFLQNESYKVLHTVPLMPKPRQDKQPYLLEALSGKLVPPVSRNQCPSESLR